MCGPSCTPDLTHPTVDMVVRLHQEGLDAIHPPIRPSSHPPRVLTALLHPCFSHLNVKAQCQAWEAGQLLQPAPPSFSLDARSVGLGAPPAHGRVSLLYPEDQPGSWWEHSCPCSAFNEYK